MNTAKRILKVVISVAGGFFFTNVCGGDAFVIYTMITYTMLTVQDNQQLKKRIDSIEKSLQSNSEETTKEE